MSDTKIDYDDIHTLRILDVADVRLFRSSPNDTRVRMTVAGERSFISVAVARGFPFSKPNEYVGFQDGDGKDIGIIPSLDGIDDESRRVIDEEMERRYFTPTVERVVNVNEFHGTVTFEVDTDRGERRFVVRNLRDNAYSIGVGRVMINDTEGNRYYFPNITELGRKAYEVLSKVA